jgi:hypothetical protein
MENDAQMKLRLPHALRDEIDAAAKANNRSMNAEIVARLTRTFATDVIEGDYQATAPFLNSLVAHLERVMEKYAIERKPGQDPK